MMAIPFLTIRSPSFSCIITFLFAIVICCSTNIRISQSFVIGNNNKYAVSSIINTPTRNRNYYVGSKCNSKTTIIRNAAAAADSGEDATTPPPPPPPVLDGKRVLPTKIMMNGLKGFSNIAGVYAVFNSNYKRGSDGWDCCTIVNFSNDVNESLTKHLEQLGSTEVAHIRALSFAVPQKEAMEEIANQWRNKVKEAGGNTLLHVTSDGMAINPSDYVFELDDDDDEDDEDDTMDDDLSSLTMTADATATKASVVSPPNTDTDDVIVSPFENDAGMKEGEEQTAGTITLNRQNVDIVLEEVRPYLIADGGNITVVDVDGENGNIFLKLEGACGSCASSTVTMQMGVERVLKEKFGDQINEIHAEGLSTGEDGSIGLSFDSVVEELRRLQPAMIAMGAVVDVVSVDSTTGVVELFYRGSNKVQQGLELAILDLDFVNKVTFTSEMPATVEE